MSRGASRGNGQTKDSFISRAQDTYIIGPLPKQENNSLNLNQAQYSALLHQPTNVTMSNETYQQKLKT